MELKIFRDSLPQAGATCTVKVELPLETEILISDYLPQVFKLVKCFVRPVVLQKRLQPGRLTLDGYLRCTVFYQGEGEAGLCQTEQKLPFAKQLELPEFSFSAWTAVVENQTEYINSRAVNPRRIELRGAVSLIASVHTQNKTEVITALADCGVEQQLQVLHGVRNTAVADKLITLEGTIQFPKAAAAILDISGTPLVRELKLLPGKAVVKGELKAQCVWRAEGAPSLLTQATSLPLNQVLDLEGVTEDSQFLCVPEAIGFTLAQDETGNAQQLTASVMLHLRSWRPYQLQYVSDAFSTQQSLTLRTQQITTESIAEQISDTIEVTGSGPLPDAGAQLRACFVTYGPTQILTRGSACVLSARATATVFVENSLAELESYEKTLDLSLPLKLTASEDAQLYPECWLYTEDVRCSCTGGTLELTAIVRAEGVILSRKTQQTLETAELAGPLTNTAPEVTLRIYYAQAQEDLFAIAKHFHVSPSQLLLANGLDPELKTLERPQHLLVPGI